MKQCHSLPGESGNYFFDSEYRLDSVNIGDMFELAPNVVVKLVEENNSLCPSQYHSSIVCFWEGSASFIFATEKGIEVRVNDHDLNPIPITHQVDSNHGPVWTDFVNNGKNYRVIGTGVRVMNRDKDKTYIKYRVTY